MKRIKKKIAAAVYEYQADCDGEWGAIQFDFVSGTAEIIRLAEWDTMVSKMFAERVEEYIRPSVKSCVSEIRQSQVWCRENSTECGLEPLLTHHPGGPDGMCAGGVNAVRFAGIF